MCCAEFIVKYVLFFANFVFCLAGLALVALGVIVLLQLPDVLGILDHVDVNIQAIPISVIVAGCVVFVIAFFGCRGAIKESRVLLIMYCVCMGILAALKLALVVILYQNLSDIQTTVSGWVVDAFGTEPFNTAFSALEVGFECCGTTGASSYISTNRPIPDSCCSTDDASSATGCTTQNSFEGCSTVVGNFFSTFGEAVAAIIVAVIVVELIALIFGWFLSSTSKNKRSYYN